MLIISPADRNVVDIFCSSKPFLRQHLHKYCQIWVSLSSFGVRLIIAPYLEEINSISKPGALTTGQWLISLLHVPAFPPGPQGTGVIKM